MGTWGSYSFLYGPVIALIAVGGLMLVSRWMSGQSSSLIERPATPGAAEEYGLMIPVADPRTSREADRIAVQLAEAGVRSRSVDTTEGLRIMVWSEDVATARAILDSPPR